MANNEKKSAFETINEAALRLSEGDHGEVPIGELLAGILSTVALLTETTLILAERINKSVGDNERP